MAPPKKAKPAATGYKLAKPLPSGVEIKDLFKKQWIVGPAIGQGGFGVIYSARLSDDKPKQYNYVLKVEPMENGPLFCEMAFYKRVAKEQYINDWIESKHLKRLGLPRLLSAGSFEHNGEQLRYLVIDRFGEDLHRIIRQRGLLSRSTALKIAIRVLDILEFIHEREYVHADIKALNLLTGREDENEIYLVDYGLAHRYIVDQQHRPEKVDPKWRHNGTLEFCARDSHTGLAPSRRGDLESLGYNLVFWLAGHLPWDRLIGGADRTRDNKPLDDKVKEAVANEKQKLMKNPKSGLLKSVDLQNIAGLCEYFNEVNNLGYTDDPDYVSLRKHLLSALKSVSRGQGKSSINIDLLEWPSAPAASASTNQKETKRKKTKGGSSSPSVSPSNREAIGNGRKAAVKATKRRSTSADRDRSVIAKKSQKSSEHNGIIPGINSASNSFTNAAKFSANPIPTNLQKQIAPSRLKAKKTSTSKSKGDSIEKKLPPQKSPRRGRISAACQTSPIF